MDWLKLWFSVSKQQLVGEIPAKIDPKLRCPLASSQAATWKGDEQERHLGCAGGLASDELIRCHSTACFSYQALTSNISTVPTELTVNQGLKQNTRP